jgi:hypothetical protein
MSKNVFPADVTISEGVEKAYGSVCGESVILEKDSIGRSERHAPVPWQIILAIHKRGDGRVMKGAMIDNSGW